jgi:RNA polymerase sigma-70 factor (ECF subfamily)
MPEDIPEDIAVEDVAEDIASCLEPMIDGLPEKYRQVIILAEYDGLSQREISEQLGMSFSGAKSRVQRSRGKLKDMLLECCHLEFDRLGHITDYQSKESSCRYCQNS